MPGVALRQSERGKFCLLTWINESSRPTLHLRMVRISGRSRNSGKVTILRKLAIAGALACACAVTPALAAPGLGNDVYGATVEKGETEIEMKYDSLRGGPDHGEDVLKLEVARGITNNLMVGVLTEFEKEPGESLKAEEVAIEAIYHLGRAGGIDFALYGEYAVNLHGPDAIEAKFLMQRRTGPWDLRFNLIAEKSLETGAKVELEYAASADVALNDRLRLGAEAFGDLGTFSHFGPAADHFFGPYAKVRLIKLPDSDGDGDDHGGLTLKAGYLFALGKTREDTDGQLRVKLEMEF